MTKRSSDDETLKKLAKELDSQRAELEDSQQQWEAQQQELQQQVETERTAKEELQSKADQLDAVREIFSPRPVVTSPPKATQSSSGSLGCACLLAPFALLFTRRGWALIALILVIVYVGRAVPSFLAGPELNRPSPGAVTSPPTKPRLAPVPANKPRPAPLPTYTLPAVTRSEPVSTPTSLALPGVDSYTFSETGKAVTGIFLEFWKTEGGLSRHGYPISDLLSERSELDGQVYIVQYFERSLFEYHPLNEDPYKVMPTQLGYLRYRTKYPTGAQNQVANPTNNQRFAETGMSIGGRIGQFWQENGGILSLGYPLSEEFTEVSEIDGKSYTVQYFERAMVELHSESTPPYDVQLARLGSFHYKEKYGDR